MSFYNSRIALNVESTNWSTIVQQSEWNDRHQKTIFNISKEVVKDIYVATCCMQGKAILWKPLQVSFTRAHALPTLLSKLYERNEVYLCEYVCVNIVF